jgi:hypothetical protein
MAHSCADLLLTELCSVTGFRGLRKAVSRFYGWSSLSGEDNKLLKDGEETSILHVWSHALVRACEAGCSIGWSR